MQIINRLIIAFSFFFVACFLYESTAYAYILKETTEVSKITISEPGEGVWTISAKLDQEGLLTQHFSGSAVERIAKSKNGILRASNLSEEDARKIPVGFVLTVPFSLELPSPNRKTNPRDTSHESIVSIVADNTTLAEKDALSAELAIKKKENEGLALQVEEMRRQLFALSENNRKNLEEMGAKHKAELAEKGSSYSPLWTVGLVFLAGGIGFIFGRYRKQNAFNDLKTKVSSLSTEMSRLCNERDAILTAKKKIASDSSFFQKKVDDLEHERKRLENVIHSLERTKEESLDYLGLMEDALETQYRHGKMNVVIVPPRVPGFKSMSQISLLLAGMEGETQIWGAPCGTKVGRSKLWRHLRECGNCRKHQEVASILDLKEKVEQEQEVPAIRSVG